MATYLVRKGAQKKLDILAKREETLRHAISHDFPESNLHRAAESVRTAQLAVIKCLLHENEICRIEDEEKYRPIHLRLASKAEQWRGMHVPAILDLYSGEVRQEPPE